MPAEVLPGVSAPYSYLDCRPSVSSDPTGLLVWWVWAIVIGALAAITECIKHHVERITASEKLDYAHYWQFMHCVVSCELGRCLGASISPWRWGGAAVVLEGGALWELGALLLREAFEHGLISRATYDWLYGKIGRPDLQDVIADAIGCACSLGRVFPTVGRLGIPLDIGIPTGIACEPCCAKLFCLLGRKVPEAFANPKGG